MHTAQEPMYCHIHTLEHMHKHTGCLSPTPAK